jgi:hypothetical protein
MLTRLYIHNFPPKKAIPCIAGYLPVWWNKLLENSCVLHRLELAFLPNIQEALQAISSKSNGRYIYATASNIKFSLLRPLAGGLTSARRRQGGGETSSTLTKEKGATCSWLFLQRNSKRSTSCFAFYADDDVFTPVKDVRSSERCSKRLHGHPARIVLFLHQKELEHLSSYSVTGLWNSFHYIIDIYIENSKGRVRSSSHGDIGLRVLLVQDPRSRNTQNNFVCSTCNVLRSA